jgi:hypothetical protein
VIGREVGVTEGWLAATIVSIMRTELTRTYRMLRPRAANWKDLGVKAGASLVMRDLWEHKDLDTFKDRFTTKVGTPATVLLRAMPVK